MYVYIYMYISIIIIAVVIIVGDRAHDLEGGEVGARGEAGLQEGGAAVDLVISKMYA